MNTDSIQALNQALRGELLFLEAYRCALQDRPEPGARLLLQGCAQLIEQRVGRLVERIRVLGGTPVSEADSPGAAVASLNAQL